MAPKSRRKNLVQSRRRTEDDGDDDAEALNDPADDSRSDVSASSVGAGDSEGSHHEHDMVGQVNADGKAVNGRTKQSKKRGAKSRRLKDDGLVGNAEQGTQFRSIPDTEAMMNGLDITDRDSRSQSINFDDTVPSSKNEPDRQHSSGVATGAQESPEDLAGHDQDGRRQRKGIKPPSVPARGGFFMHDARGNTPNGNTGNQPGRRGPAGRNAVTNGFGPNNGTQNTAKMRWDHDLHDTLLESHPSVLPKAPQVVGSAPSHHTRPTVNSLSTSTSIGTVSVRVLLPDMEKPIVFERMPVRQHTRLPDLRPPLRRDKPVRVAVPEATVRYIFPSTERSFIFIPRAQRPGMHSGRARARGGFNQYGSRRNSIYGGGGGSVYTPSVARSRRSSQARDGFISPTGSVMSKAPFGAPTGPSRPVVKLPVNGQPYEIGAHFQGVIPTQPIMALPPNQFNPPPAQPALRETHASQIPMHQPRPQKQVSVLSIESPNPGALHAPQQQEQQPFHHQVPSHMSAQQSPYDPSSASAGHSRQQSYSGQPAEGTPLSNIPEQAVNAQPFQPNALPPQAFFQPHPYPVFYYPNPEAQPEHYDGNSSAPPPYFVQQPQQGGFMMPMMMMPAPGPGSDDQAGGLGPGMLAQESNGMVYYYPQMVPPGDGMPTPGNFGGVPGADGYYYNAAPQGMMFYPPQ